MTDSDLASARRCIDRIRDRWPAFQDMRHRHLGAVSSDVVPAEKVAENILCDLFTNVLDWATEQVRLQENRVDITLTRNGLKYAIIEVKRPGSFDGRGSIERALDQARRYAADLKVDKVVVSDGCVFEAYDLLPGGRRPRAVAHLALDAPPDDLWWLSTRGIYRTPPGVVVDWPADDGPRHPKYGLPARCFAYVGDPNRPATWKLPYLLIDGTVDGKRLPKAIGAVIRDYRSEQVKGLPEHDVGGVLARLASAALRTGRMPEQDPTPADIYVALRERLDQLGIVGEIAEPVTPK